MRWPYKNPLHWHQKFAYLPRVIEGQWVWWEFYWARLVTAHAWVDVWEYSLDSPREK
jgi:hypothetical protein